MSKSFKLRVEEYLPAGSFLAISFTRDRAELEQTFKEFTPAYLQAFSNQIATVATLESALVLTESQKLVTQNLYQEKDMLNKQLNFLAYYFKRANLGTVAIRAIKKDLRTANIEGANLKIKGLIQLIEIQKEVLESKGMNIGYGNALAAKNDSLLAKNIQQNAIMNERHALADDNKEAYKMLYNFISNIAEAGKILFEDDVRYDEYVLKNIIGRMRAFS